METIKRYICTVCNSVYEQPKDGEKRPSFEDLAEDWHHAECAATKDYFQPCTCVSFNLYETTAVQLRSA